MENFYKLLSACLFLTCVNVTFANTTVVSSSYPKYKFSIFAGGGFVSTSNIQAVKYYTVNGVSYPYDEILVSSNINGGGNIGIAYDVNRYFSLALNYTNLGKQDFGIIYQTEQGMDAIGATLQNKIVAIEGMLFLPKENFSPFVKIGYARYDLRWYHYSDVPGININQDASVTVKGNALVYGIGVRFPVYTPLSMDVFFDGIYSFNNTSQATSISQYYAGLNLVYQLCV